MNHRLVAILALIAVLSTSACAAASPQSSAVAPADGVAARAVPPAPQAPGAALAPHQAATGGSAGQTDAQQASTVPSLDRMIIRTVTMTIAVDNVKDTFQKVEALANAQNGYLAGTQIRQDGDRQVATITLRVPADNATYTATLEQLRAMAKEVVDEQSQAQDVTDQYVDLDARLRNLRASEESLLQILSKAQKVDDILAVQRELTNVRGQIEQIQGQKQVLERKADLATITLTIREVGTFSRPSWSAGGTFAEAFQALVAALRGLTILTIWLLVFSPIWGGFIAGIWLFIWLIRRLFRRRRPAVRPTVATATPPAAPAA